MNNRIKIGFLPTSRNFFSQQLAMQMRIRTIEVFEEMGIDCIVVNPSQTKNGCVESREEAVVCGKLFRDAKVDGILVGAMNFGDEQSVAIALRESGLIVPVMIFGCQESEPLRKGMARRDSFCGLLSIGETLRQQNIPYSIGKKPICLPTDASFHDDLRWFVKVCRVVNGIRKARYAQIGIRPDAFWTCRYDEKALQRLGPTTVTLGLSDMISKANQIPDNSPQLQDTVKKISGYADHSGVPGKAMLQMARLEMFLSEFKNEHNIDAYAIQCWTSIQNDFGVCACTAMSRLCELGVPCACEADILGAMSMHALQLASDMPSALADWNNMHHKDDDLVNLWHCGVYPKSFTNDHVQISVHNILVSSNASKKENSHGVVEMKVKPGPTTLCRVTETGIGGYRAVLVDAQFEDHPEETEGGYGWCRVNNMQMLYRNTLLRYYPHHVAMAQTHCSEIIREAFERYLNIQLD